jgi:hypothetical protein
MTKGTEMGDWKLEPLSADELLRIQLAGDREWEAKLKREGVERFGEAPRPRGVICEYHPYQRGLREVGD